jgi:hypothetical protein
MSVIFSEISSCDLDWMSKKYSLCWISGKIYSYPVRCHSGDFVKNRIFRASSVMLLFNGMWCYISIFSFS